MEGQETVREIQRTDNETCGHCGRPICKDCGECSGCYCDEDFYEENPDHAGEDRYISDWAGEDT